MIIIIFQKNDYYEFNQNTYPCQSVQNAVAKLKKATSSARSADNR